MTRVADAWVAIDTGGTFTDLAARMPGGEEVRVKVPSVPEAPWRAVLDAMTAWQKRTGEHRPAHIRHGSTVATNALLERRGARVVLITTPGIEDVLALRRQNRPLLYALHPVLPPPLVPADCVVPVAGRLDARGHELEPLEDLGPWLDCHASLLEQAEALAICLLHAYANPAHEQNVAAALRQRLPDKPITVSSELVPLSREYERASTVAVNAYVAPIMTRYLGQLAAALSPTPVSVMGSTGGLMSARRATSEPVQTILSGPAGGVRGAWHVGLRCSREALLSLDMGGTSTDISVVLGELFPEDDGYIAEHALRMPLLPIETIGAGGGSIAQVDEGGALRVGPHSAGAVPGPACYGRAGPLAEPTVTDAHVVLGRLPQLLGGQMPMDPQASESAVARIAHQLGSSVEDTAQAILAVTEANMARACKRVTMERGIDPRTLTLVAFGGAGGLHACALADALGCREVIFPEEPGVLSAEGMLHAPHETSASRALFLDELAWDTATLQGHFDETLAKAVQRLGDDVGTVSPTLQALADCRYRGQTFTLAVDLSEVVGPDLLGGLSAASRLEEDLRAAFDQRHRTRYGYVLGRDRPVELVAIRAFARTPSEVPRPAVAGGPDSAVLKGPSVVPAYSATLYLPDCWRAERMASGDLLCQRTRPRRRSVLTRAEPLALEVHRQRLAAVAEEMGAALMRAAFSANIKERRDFSCAVFDGQGRMLVQAAHIPVHLGSQPMSVEAAIQAVPMRPGSAVILNDPFAGGTHLPDITLVAPVFAPGGEHRAPLFYVSNRAHHADVGGLTPGSMPVSADGGLVRIDDEGFRIPPSELTDAVCEQLAAASRTPDERRGDLLAQQAANGVGARRLLELLEEVDEPTLASSNEALLDYSERRMRAIIRDLEDGTYAFTDHLDDDGAGGPPVPIPVVLTINGERAVADFSAAPDALPSSLNTVRAIAVSAVFYVFRCLGGEGVPENAGLMRPIEVVTRRGSLCDAQPPAAVSAGNVETSQRLVDALYGALTQAAPDRIPAASCGSMNNVLCGGTDSRPGSSHGQPFVHYETLGGGGGGSPFGPGATAVHTHMTNTLNTPIEELERLFPIRITKYGIRPARGAANPEIYPGGRGVVRAYTFLCAAEVTLVTERRIVPPYGVGGAPPGELGRNTLRHADGKVSELPGKITTRVRAGDTLVIETPGGGQLAQARPNRAVLTAGLVSYLPNKSASMDFSSAGVNS
ncbi:hydantoinase B/oxoprolinase family protein [Myxococcota bacterium]